MATSRYTHTEHLVAPLVKPLARRLADNGIAYLPWLSRSAACLECSAQVSIRLASILLFFAIAVRSGTCLLSICVLKGSNCPPPRASGIVNAIRHERVQELILELPQSCHYGIESECSHVHMWTNAGERGATMFPHNGASAQLHFCTWQSRPVPTIIRRPSMPSSSKSSRDPSSSRTCVGVAAPSEDRRVGDMEALRTFAPHEMKQRAGGR